MIFTLVVEVPDDVLEREWLDACEEGETTETLAMWRGHQPEAARDYLRGWFTKATVNVLDAGPR